MAILIGPANKNGPLLDTSKGPQGATRKNAGLVVGYEAADRL